MLRITIISDIHHGSNRGTKKGEMAIPLFRKFLSHLSTRDPDFVVDLGDRISDVDEQTDLILLKEIAEQLRQIKQPTAHILGNHDVKKLSIEQSEKILGCSLSSYSVDINGYHLIFWNADTLLNKETGFLLKEIDFEWLAADLANTALPSIIFTHVPLDNGSMRGNFYFDRAHPNKAHYPLEQGERVREILESSEKVFLCFNGHTHWNAYHVIDGIHYVTIPSLTETYTTFPEINQAWADVDIKDEIHIRIHGLTPMEYKLPIKNLNTHWANIYKAYAPASEKPA